MSFAAVAILLPHASTPTIAVPAPLDTLVDAGGYRLHVVLHRGTRPLTIVRSLIETP